MGEKRKHHRVDTKIKSEVHALEGMTYSTSADLSYGGIFITTPEPIMIGSQINLSLHIPGGEEINIKGVVKWLREEEDETKKSGMGIEFVDASDKILEIVKKVMES